MKRPLTDGERKCVALQRLFETLADRRALVGKLYARDEKFVNAMSRVYHVLKSDWSVEKSAYVVTISLTDFAHYAAVQCARHGVSVYIDGSMQMEDGLILEDGDEL